MSKPSNFQLTTDFATLKNDAIGDITLTFAGSQVLLGNTVKTITDTIDLGVRGASLRSRIGSSKDSNTWYICSSASYRRVGSVPANPTAGYSVIALVSRTSPTTITVAATVLNPYGVTLPTAAGAETFSFRLNTLLPPFVS